MTSYNPLNQDNLAASVGAALLGSNCVPLPPEPTFPGAGIYALYYHGNFEPYARLSVPRCGGTPIYIGKAMPGGGRKGGTPAIANRLYLRLRRHARNIAATNLRVADFTCRYLIVDPMWIVMGEQVAINRFHPLWNSGPIDGFGSNPQGKGRNAGRRSTWDILHPGRKNTDILRADKTFAQVAADVQGYLEGRIAPRTPTLDEDEDE